MTKDEAISSLINSCQEFKSALEKALEENAFLADTIEKHNLRKIEEERRLILKEKAEAEEKRIEAEKIQAKFQKKFSDVQTMQNELNIFIEKRAEAKFRQMQESLNITENKKKNIRNRIISLTGYLIAAAVIILHFIFF